MSINPGKKICVLCAIVLACLSTGTAFAAGEAKYKSGLQAYKQKDFRSAAEQFQASIAQGNKAPIVLLYLGHAYYGSGEVARSLKAYCDLADKYPASGEALLAVQQIQRLDANTARKYGALLAAAAPGAASKRELISKVVVVEPQFGHAKVRPQTIDIVKKGIMRLDPRFSKLLADGGASITISPNTLDRWPNGGGDTIVIPAATDTLLAEAGGQTYHRDNTGPDINIFERPILRGTKNLKEPFSDDQLLHTTLHELGHAVDDLQKLSADGNFLAAHAQDKAQLSSDDSSQYHYFITPMEACAEITSGLIGHNESESETANVMRCFPRSTRWLKQRLQL